MRIFEAANSRILAKVASSDKRSKILYLALFYSLLLTIFITIVGQSPLFAARGLTKIFQLGWIVVAFLACFISYKAFIQSLIRAFFLLAPFLAYCLLARCFGVMSITDPGTITIFLASFIFAIGLFFSKFFSLSQFKLCLFAFLAGSVILGGIVFLTKLRGADISGGAYAYGSKNSAGPIFMIAGFAGFLVFSKKSVTHYILKYALLAFFLALIILMKTRAVIIAFPLFFLLHIHYAIPKLRWQLTVYGVLLFGFLVVVFVPALNKAIIQDFLFNGKTSFDDISSLRITSIIENLSTFKPLLGTGGSYVDCMPVSFLCTYGVTGFLTVIPLIVVPFRGLVCSKRAFGRGFYIFYLFVLVLLTVNSLLEGYGLFGPGAKTFVLWFACGLAYEPLFIHKIWSRKYVERVPRPSFSCAFFLAFTVIAFSLILASDVNYSLARAAAERLPSANSSATYRPTGKTKISMPVKEMCLGQRITFGIDTEFDEYDDGVVSWSTGWVVDPLVSVDGVSGQVTAVKKGLALVHADFLRQTNGEIVQFKITDPADYAFDQFFISTEDFSRSFAYREDPIKLGVGSSRPFFYDSFYIPPSVVPEFFVSDPQVASIDAETGVLVAQKAGTCTVKCKIRIGEKVFQSRNSLPVEVVDSGFVHATSLYADLADSYPCHVPIDLKVVFNEGATDQSFDFSAIGVSFSREKHTVTFSSPGNATLHITSRENPSLSYTKEVKILPNRPLSFSCEKSKLVVGREYSPANLGLFLNFESGDKVLVSDNDLFYASNDLSNRAWNDKNGLVKNRTTIKTIIKGTVSLTLVSKIDHNITETFRFDVSPYTEEQFNELTRACQMVICVIGHVFMMFSLLLLEADGALYRVIFGILSTSVSIVPLFFIYGVSTQTIIGAVAMGLISLATLGVIVFVLKEKPLISFDDSGLKYPITIRSIHADVYRL